MGLAGTEESHSVTRWTNRVMWITNTEPVLRGWYPIGLTEETHYSPAGRYIRQRRWWWPIVVLFRIARSAS